MSVTISTAAALDKNYIDTADTRVVQPAVDWYERHGKPEDRLKAYMYLGTEQLNGGEYNKAIVSFYKARTSASGVEDKNLLGVLCADTGSYLRLLQFDVIFCSSDILLEPW